MAHQTRPGGTVIKRGKAWTAILYYPDPRTGKRRQRWHSAPKKRDAEEWLAEQLRAETPIAPTKLTVEEFLDQWLEARRPQIRPTTWGGYRTAKRHLVTAFGPKPLAALMPLDLQRLYTRMLAQDYSTRTVRYVHTTIHTALKDAVAWDYLTRNIADRVKPPKLVQKERQPLMSGDMPCFIEQIQGDERPALWWLLILTGFRRGEALGLRWQDIHWQNARAVIRQTWIKGPDGPMWSTPKTARSRRSVALPPRVVEELEAHHARQNDVRRRAGDLWQDYDLVFCKEDGTPLYPDFPTKHLKILLKNAGLSEDTTLHDLRHTAATLMFEGNTHPKVVSEQLGHSSVSITLDLYSHMIPGLKDAGARTAQDVVESAIKANATQNKKPARTSNTIRSNKSR